MPQSLTYLEFGEDFNQPLNNLPKSITQVSIAYRFLVIASVIPNSITHLKIIGNSNTDSFSSYDHYVLRDLPYTIEEISMPKKIYEELMKYAIPNNSIKINLY